MAITIHVGIMFKSLASVVASVRSVVAAAGSAATATGSKWATVGGRQRPDLVRSREAVPRSTTAVIKFAAAVSFEVAASGGGRRRPIMLSVGGSLFVKLPGYFCPVTNNNSYFVNFYTLILFWQLRI
ncbi:unnamed protein product [Cuscuta epithymum]|uniref:Secreted protein n=1 Tax=Cuscuta epithymum TaxID=186058 RepID=A0AAV0CHK9_9ASTE|nr:unnamed protein product [Cuscuta epithymum]